MKFRDLPKEKAEAIIECLSLIILIGELKLSSIRPKNIGNNLEQVEAAIEQTNTSLKEVQDAVEKATNDLQDEEEFLAKICRLIDPAITVLKLSMPLEDKDLIRLKELQEVIRTIPISNAQA